MEISVSEKTEMTAEELAEFNGNLSESFKDGLEDGSTIVDEGPWEKTVAKIRAMRKARKLENSSRPVTMRIPVRVIEGYKAKAAAEGVGYQTLMNEVLEAALA